MPREHAASAHVETPDQWLKHPARFNVSVLADRAERRAPRHP